MKILQSLYINLCRFKSIIIPLKWFHCDIYLTFAAPGLFTSWVKLRQKRAAPGKSLLFRLSPVSRKITFVKQINHKEMYYHMYRYILVWRVPICYIWHLALCSFFCIQDKVYPYVPVTTCLMAKRGRGFKT